MRTETQQSLDNLFSARWNLPTAADNCGLGYDEMRIMFNHYCKTNPLLIMRTQRKENYYYVFWTVAMIAFIVPQVFTAYAYMNIKALLENLLR